MKGPSAVELALAALLVVAFALSLVNLGHEQLTLWDESFHANVAGNLVGHPFRFTLYDEPVVSLPSWSMSHLWLHKPPPAG